MKLFLMMCYSPMIALTGLSLRAVTCNTCYGWVCLFFPWYYWWNCLLLTEFNHKVSSLLWVWRARLQVTQNLMTALVKCKLLPVQSQGNFTKKWSLDNAIQGFSMALPSWCKNNILHHALQIWWMCTKIFRHFYFYSTLVFIILGDTF